MNLSGGPEPTASQLLDIYRRLRTSQGLQHWWPGESSFEVVIGCILTQNTNWGNVEKAITNLKLADALLPSKILAIPIDHLIELIRPTGFHTQKPVRLKSISRWWLDIWGDDVRPLAHENETEWGSDHGSLRIPSPPLTPRELGELRAELLATRGIGPETADSIILYALGLPAFVVDAYTRRIFSRLGLVKETCRYDELQSLFQSNLPQSLHLFFDYHAQLIALAKNNCRKTPVCKGCPLDEVCLKCFLPKY